MNFSIGNVVVFYGDIIAQPFGIVKMILKGWMIFLYPVDENHRREARNKSKVDARPQTDARAATARRRLLAACILPFSTVIRSKAG